jgi:hypothetical protein
MYIFLTWDARLEIYIVFLWAYQDHVRLAQPHSRVQRKLEQISTFQSWGEGWVRHTMATWLPATEKTLSTAELLESILLQLDLQTLLTSAQRTCRTWTNLIRGSPALQRALYFTPVSDTRGHEAVLNPLLIDTFPSFFEVENETLFGGGNGTLLASLRMFKQPETQASFLREEASWRRMLVQQPPVFKIARWHCSVGQFGVYLYREIPVSLLAALLRPSG